MGTNKVGSELTRGQGLPVPAPVPGLIPPQARVPGPEKSVRKGSAGCRRKVSPAQKEPLS